jgi:hypothetical protein
MERLQQLKFKIGLKNGKQVKKLQRVKNMRKKELEKLNSTGRK